MISVNQLECLGVLPFVFYLNYIKLTMTSHYLQASENMLPDDVNSTMTRLMKIERLAEEILVLR